MTDRGWKARILAVTLVAATLVALAPAPVKAEEKQYATTTLSGHLKDAEGQPLEAATIRLVSIEETPEKYEALTDSTGAFSLEGVPYGRYAMEIRTEGGDRIHGVNAVPVGEDRQRVEMSLSPNVFSDTTLFTQKGNFQVEVRRIPPEWSRFWKEFLIFFGVAAGGAVVF